LYGSLSRQMKKFPNDGKDFEKRERLDISSWSNERFFKIHPDKGGRDGSLKEELMELDFTDKLEKICRNRYEAVLLVAKQARRLNVERMKAESLTAQVGEEETANQEKEEKVVNQALREVIEGKIKFDRPEEKPKSELKRP